MTRRPTKPSLLTSKSIYNAILNGGGGDKPDSYFDPIWLSRGTDIELEHTSCRYAAEIIAKQHLFEFPRYYEFLIEMEERLQADMLKNRIRNLK